MCKSVLNIMPKPFMSFYISLTLEGMNLKTAVQMPSVQKIAITAAGIFAFYSGVPLCALAAVGSILCPGATLIGASTLLGIHGISMVINGLAAKALIPAACGVLYAVGSWYALDHYGDHYIQQFI